MEKWNLKNKNKKICSRNRVIVEQNKQKLWRLGIVIGYIVGALHVASYQGHFGSFGALTVLNITFSKTICHF